MIPKSTTPRVRTAHKISALEKKIDLLTNALLVKSVQDGSATTSSISSRQRGNEEITDDSPGPDDFGNGSGIDLPHTPPSSAGSLVNLGHANVIDRGIVTLDTAAGLFDHWRHDMSFYIPVVSPSDIVESQQIHTTRHVSFLAVLAASSASIEPTLRRELLPELITQLAERILLTGEKSIDLVQAILIYVSFFMLPVLAKQSSYIQYSHMAASISLDLGLNKKLPSHEGDSSSQRISLARTWVACYYITSK